VSTKVSPDARFLKLVRRALFELRLAADIARADSYEPQVRALVEGARGNLRRVLRLAEPANSLESETKSRK
jgi:hypothetical protein